ncbi:MAG: hypothetical protein Q9219_006685 [cf. Caloplaca sp. 3 TL-2023]
MAIHSGGGDLEDRMEPVAIIGFSARMPQDAETPESFWRMLCEGRSTRTPIPKDRFNVDAFYHSDPERVDATNVRSGNFIKGNIATFDAPFFAIQPAEVESMDPQQSLLLEESYKALENAGITMGSIAASSTSVYVGSSSRDYEALLFRDPEVPAKYVATGIGTALLANRISWFYDLRGPSISLDTACSSGLTAVHLACQSLRNGESSMALAGGCNLILAPDVSMVHLSNMGFFSPDGQCYSFDERANGYAKGEGVGFLVLKRLSDALKDGDVIRAVIRASGANQDGRTPAITQPSQIAQEENILETYRAGGLDLSSTGYFEAHGTGTQIGDSTEAAAIAAAFHGKRNGPLLIGALKPNIGHLESASGIASMIKAIMILENGLIPPNIFFAKPNHKIVTNEIKHPDFSETPLCRIPDMTGNYTTMLDASPRTNGIIPGSTSSYTSTMQPRLFIFSAADEHGINRAVAALREHLSSSSLSSTKYPYSYLQNLAYTLSEKRSKLPWRSSTTAHSVEELQENLVSRLSKPVRSSTNPTISFIFTGQGAQWAGMGQELDIFTVFRRSLERSEMYLRGLSCSWSLLDELQKEGGSSDIDSPEKSQPICTAVQIALVDLLTDWGISPRAIVGHSSGEIAAVYCAHGLSHESAIKVAFHRGSLASQVASSSKTFGGMMSVGLSEEAIAPFTNAINEKLNGESISIGCINSPTSVTVTGSRNAIDALEALMKEEGIFARKLPVNVAYHSAHMQSIAAEYTRRIGKVSTRDRGRCAVSDAPTLYSSVTGTQLAVDSMTRAEYWKDNLVSKVQFSKALQHMLDHLVRQEGNKVHLLLEVGPTSALQRPVKDTINHLGQSSCFQYDAILKRGASSLSSCLEAVGRLTSSGHKINLMPINFPDIPTSSLRCLTDLPSYQFNQSRQYWVESRTSRNFRFRKHARHELLGTQVADWNPLQPRWRNIIRAKEQPWVLDHQMSGSTLYPASGMITMVIEGIRQLADPKREPTGYKLENVLFNKALPIPLNGDGVETQLHFDRRKFATDKLFESDDFTVSAYIAEEWQSLCVGTVIMEQAIPTDQDDIHGCAGLDRSDCEPIRTFGDKQCMDEIDANQFYQNLALCGFKYGPTFQLLHGIRYNQDGQARASIQLGQGKDQEEYGSIQEHVIHPTALDSLGQLCMAAVGNGSWDVIPTMVPTRLKSLWISNSLLKSDNNTPLNIYASVSLRGFRDTEFSVVAQDSEEKPQIIAEAWRETALDTPDMAAWDKSRIQCHQIVWKPDITLLTGFETAAAITKNAPFDKAESSSCSHDISLFESLEMASIYFSKLSVKAGYRVTSSSTPLQLHSEWIISKVNEFNIDWNNVCRKQVNRMLEDKAYASAFLAELAKNTAEGDLLVNLGANLGAILAGETTAHDILLNQQLMSKYLCSSVPQQMYAKMAAYIDLLAHKKPDQRILEINAGNGSLTDVILDELAPNNPIAGKVKIPKFGLYDHTDPSHAFFEEVSGRFEHLSTSMECRTLNLTDNVVDQGFEDESYDVVVGRTFLGPPLDLETLLTQSRRLLKRGGKLILYGPTNPNCWWTTFVFGLLPGWWSADDDGTKTDRPIMAGQKWRDMLLRRGYTGAKVCIPDSDGEDSYSMGVLITTAADKASPRNDTAVTLVVSDGSDIQSAIASGVVTCLSATSTSMCEVRSLKELQANDQKGIAYVSLLDIDTAVLRDPSEAEFTTLKTMISSSKGVLWVTRGGGDKAPRPDAALITGLGRNMLSENFCMKFIELAVEMDSPMSQVIDHVTNLIVSRLLPSNHDLESEFRERNGQLCIGRAMPDKELDEMVSTKSTTRAPEIQKLGQLPNRALALTIGSPGLLNTLHFKDDPVFYNPLADDEVEIKVHATGVNFKDIIIALGQLAGDTLGFECAGIVTRNGRLAGEFRPGDRVCCCTTTGAYKTFARAHATSVAKIPDHLSFPAAAAIPLTYCTAHYSLKSVARLQEGESVLIHSAAGGVGQAAIIIAKQLKATIYVTVGTEEKRRLLRDRYGIPETHIFSSRSAQFAKSLMRTTPGVDVVLNSLSGELLRASWSCVAPFGRFVELGKSDINSREGLPMLPFDKNITFASVDLGMVMNHAKKVMGSTLKEVMAYWSNAKADIGVSPLHVYNVSELEQGFRSMQSGTNMGKIVIKMDQEAVVPVVPHAGNRASFDPAATYVIAGGLGGIGRSITRWMAHQGARYLLLLSRSGAKSKAAVELLEEMHDRGVEVQTPACDISDEGALSRVLERMTESMPPIKGCIQASMVLRDGLFENMSYSDFCAVLKPKVDGSWNLHLHLPPELDFFVLLSSVSGVTGARAQANYAAGNTFQNALARHRVSLGQRCISLDLGPVLMSGAVTEQGLAASLEAVGLQSISRNPFFALLDYCCDGSRLVPFEGTEKEQSHIITGLGGINLLPPERRGQVYWSRKPLFSILGQIVRSSDPAATTQSTPEGPNHAKLLHDAESAAAAVKVVTDALIRKVAQNLNVPDVDIDAEKPMYAYGIDSLVAVEVRYWLNKELSAEVTIWEIMQAKSLTDLAMLAAGRSRHRQEGNNEDIEAT